MTSQAAPRLGRGDRVVSIGGEWDEGDNGERRETGPNASGEIQDFAFGHYEVTFANGTHVRITPEEIADPAQYKVLDRDPRECHGRFWAMVRSVRHAWRWGP